MEKEFQGFTWSNKTLSISSLWQVTYMYYNVYRNQKKNYKKEILKTSIIKKMKFFKKASNLQEGKKRGWKRIEKTRNK